MNFKRRGFKQPSSKQKTPKKKKTGLRRQQKFKGGASGSIVNRLFKNQGQSHLQITLRSLKLQTTINSKRNKKINPLTLGQDVSVLKMCYGCPFCGIHMLLLHQPQILIFTNQVANQVHYALKPNQGHY